MRVLVTGNLGYIGPVVTRHLKAAGHYVFGLDTGWFLPNLASLPEWPDEQRFRDFRVPTVGLHPEAVVHLAGLSNDPMGELDPTLTDAINYGGTLAAIKGNPAARHVVISSCSVYGASDMATEESELAPLTTYAQTKAYIDDELHGAVGWANAVSLRLGTVYGYSPGHRLDLVVNRMTYDAVHGRGVTVTGDASRPLVHVEDVARAIVFMLERPETGIYNVVGDNYQIDVLGQLVATITGATLIRKPSDTDARDYMADGSKLINLGWEPRYTVAGSLPVLAEKSLSLLGVPSRYVRLSALKNLIESGVIGPDLRRKEPIAA